MKKILGITTTVLFILGMTFSVVSAQSIPTISPWKMLGNVISPSASSSIVKIPSLSSATTTCVTASTNGTLSTSTCGSDTSGFVPYTGATTDVDLGNHTLTLNGMKMSADSKYFTFEETTTAGSDVGIKIKGAYPQFNWIKPDGNIQWKWYANTAANILYLENTQTGTNPLYISGAYTTIKGLDVQERLGVNFSIVGAPYFSVNSASESNSAQFLSSDADRTMIRFGNTDLSKLMYFGIDKRNAYGIYAYYNENGDISNPLFTIKSNLNGGDGSTRAYGSFTATSLIKSGGTSSQFLKADGSVDSSTYLATGLALLLDQSTQQHVINDRPFFDAGINVGKRLSFSSVFTLDSNVDNFYNAGSVTYGNYIYAQTSGDSHIDIIDTSASTFNIVGTFAAPDDIEGMVIHGHYLFVVAAVGSNKFNIYDLTNPLSPSLVSSTATAGWGEGIDIDPTGQYVFFSDYDNGNILSYDVTNKASPSLVSTVSNVYGTPTTVRYSNGYLTVVAQTGYIQKFSVSAGVPTLIGSTATGNSFGHYTKDDVSYVLGDANYSNSNLYIYNVSSSTPVLLSTINSSTGGNVNGHSVELNNNLLYVTGPSSALVIIDVKDPVSPQIVYTSTDTVNSGSLLDITGLGDVSILSPLGNYLYDVNATTTYGTANINNNGTVTAQKFVKNGGTSSQILLANGSTLSTSTYLTTSTASSTYVPYTGATGNVNLGANSITATALKANTSAGVSIQNVSGSTTALFGAGSGLNATFYDGVKLNSQTASRILSTDSSSNITALDTATYPSLTELSYVKGVTSAIQTQIDAKFTLPSLTSGSVLFSNGTTIAQDNANFFWDDTNNRLGIGTTSPAERIHVSVSTANFIKTESTSALDAGWKFSNTSRGFMYYIQSDGALILRDTTANVNKWYITTNGVGVGNFFGATAPAAQLHVLYTGEQFRVGYDASNYYSTTVGSTGTVTLDAVGSGSKFVYSDRLTIPDGTAALPSIGFTSDDDGSGTGFYRSSANRLGVAANGAFIGQFLSTGFEMDSALSFTWNNRGGIGSSANGTVRLSANGGANLTTFILGQNDGTGFGLRFGTNAMSLDNGAGTYTNRNLGIGVAPTSVTARLHLGAGTATASTSPLKFTSGTLLTVPEVGAVEFLNDAWYGTITTGSARKTFAFLESPAFTGTSTFSGPVSMQGSFGEIYVHDASTTVQSISTGTAYTKSTAFVSNGLSGNSITNDVTNDRIVINRAGKYRLNIAVSFSDGANITWTFAGLLGGVEMTNVHASRKMGAGGDVGALNISGFFTATSTSIVELGVQHDSVISQNLDIWDANMNVEYIGE